MYNRKNIAMDQKVQNIDLSLKINSSDRNKDIGSPYSQSAEKTFIYLAWQKLDLIIYDSGPKKKLVMV